MELINRLTAAIFVVAMTLLFAMFSRARLVKKLALITVGLVIAMLLWGCGTPKDNNGQDMAIIIASRGTVIKTDLFKKNVFGDKGCTVIVRVDNGLKIAIIKNDANSCKELKKGDRVFFSIVVEPSSIDPGNIEKI